MIQLSGVEDIEIIETGLKPGEKLYEEIEKTDNNIIFIEWGEVICMDELDEKIEMLRAACGVVGMKAGYRDENICKEMVLT